MLTITVPLSELFDEATGRFVIEGEQLQFEHSLTSLSKWEAKYERPFLSDKELTSEESLFYIEHCMLRTPNPPAGIFQKLTQKNVDAIEAYINGKHSATWFNDPKNAPRGRRQVVTAAVIRSWMVQLNLPFEASDWHLNELFDLIRVVNEQQKQPKKMSRGDAARQQASLNAKRRAELGTRG